MTHTDSSPVSTPLWLACPEEVADVSLGEKLKTLRREKAWSQDEFAFNAQIDGRQVSRYENGRVMPSIEVVIKMAKAYDVSLDYLLLEESPRRPLEMPISRLAERVLSLPPISDDDERALLHLVDSIEAKNRLKELAAGVG